MFVLILLNSAAYIGTFKQALNTQKPHWLTTIQNLELKILKMQKFAIAYDRFILPCKELSWADHKKRLKIIIKT